MSREVGLGFWGGARRGYCPNVQEFCGPARQKAVDTSVLFPVCPVPPDVSSFRGKHQRPPLPFAFVSQPHPQGESTNCYCSYRILQTVRLFPSEFSVTRLRRIHRIPTFTTKVRVRTSNLARQPSLSLPATGRQWGNPGSRARRPRENLFAHSAHIY